MPGVDGLQCRLDMALHGVFLDPRHGTPRPHQGHVAPKGHRRLAQVRVPLAQIQPALPQEGGSKGALRTRVV
jgi:hypothetical protein